MSISLFLKQACKIGTSQLYVTWNSTIIREKTGRHAHLLLQQNYFSREVALRKKKLWPVHKEIKEAMDGLTSVKNKKKKSSSRGSSGPNKTLVKENKILQFNKKVYGIFKKHINP